MEEDEGATVAEDGSRHLGECHGGPLNGKDAVSRYPKGFLLVDKPANRVWIYDWNGLAFVCRDAEGSVTEYERRLKAADSPDWDVVSFVGGGAS